MNQHNQPNETANRFVTIFCMFLPLIITLVPFVLGYSENAGRFGLFISVLSIGIAIFSFLLSFRYIQTENYKSCVTISVLTVVVELILLLFVILLLNAAPAPNEVLMRNDIVDYITEEKDNTATITDFKCIENSHRGSKAACKCIVTYLAEKREYTETFSLEYQFTDGEWVLKKCSPEQSSLQDNSATKPVSTDTPPPSDTTPNPPPTESASSNTEPKQQWRISHSKKTLRVGDSFKLRVTDQTGAEADVSWRSSKSGIVSISGNRITALAEGEVKVTCSVDGQNFSCSIVVKAKATTTTPSTEPPAPPATTAPTELPKETDPPTTAPTDPPAPPPTTTPTEPPAPPTTEPTEPPKETDPSEPQGKAPSGYSIRLSPKEVYVFQTFYVTVNPDVSDYTKIVIHAIDPTGGKWDFEITSGNSYDLMVTQMDLTGTWTIYADVYNDYGVFYGASSGAKAYLTVYELPI